MSPRAVDATREVVGLALQDLQVSIRRRVRLPRSNDVQRHPHRREGIAELVREHGEKFVLAAVRLGLHLFGLLALGDVRARADVAEEVLVLAAPRDAVIEEPPVRAVRDPHAILEIEGLVTGHGSPEDLPDARAIFGVDRIEPAHAMRVFLRLPRDPLPGRVDVMTRPGRVGQPDDDRRIVGERAEAFLAFAQALGLLRHLPA